MASSSKSANDRRHKKEWESEDWAKGWLKSDSEAPSCYQANTHQGHSSWCFACKISLRSHKIDLKKHAESTKHKNSYGVLFRQNSIDQFVIVHQSHESKIIDIKIAVFIAKHCPVASVDHLSTLLKNCSTKENPFEKIRLHRTKCSAIIKNVVSPSLLEALVKDIGESKYSLIVDESTDVSQTKWMSICISFFDVKNFVVSTQFLGLYLVEEATAEHLFQSLKSFLEKTSLNIKNLIAIGTDGANNLCGKNKSLFTLLKKENPQIVLVKCTCHSLNLCCSKASSAISKNADFLIKELYNYFSHSPLRSVLYKRAFDLINTGVDSQRFRKLVQISGTRWLSYGAAVNRVLEQWVELKYHFSLISTVENDKTAQHIYNELCDKKNQLFLLFINPIVNEMNNLNIQFQSDSMDAGSMHQKLCSTLLLFSSKIFLPSVLTNAENIDNLIVVLNTAIDTPSSFLTVDLIDFGSEFETSLGETVMSDEEVYSLKENCFIYLKMLLKEMLNRLPDNINIFKVYRYFSFSMCCKTPQIKFLEVREALKPLMDPLVPMGTYETQWSKLPFVNWIDFFDNAIPTNLLELWPKIYNYTDAAGTYYFKEIALVVLNMLVIPTSNACVERIFSIMNYTKTRFRSKMQYELLNALLRIINNMNVNKTCCNSFVPSSDMLRRFNTNTMYLNENKNEAEDNAVYDLIDECIN